MDSPQQYDQTQKVVSPFAHTQAVVPVKKSGTGKIVIWIVAIVLLLGAGGFGGVFLTRYLNDPLRTLESFPVAKYLDGYHSLAGARFKGQLRVEADLGWREGTGRLMLFTCPDDNRPIAVMIPADVANGMYFNKGQTYLAELEVKEGGLIYANSFRKSNSVFGPGSAPDTGPSMTAMSEPSAPTEAGSASPAPAADEAPSMKESGAVARAPEAPAVPAPQPAAASGGASTTSLVLDYLYNHKPMGGSAAEQAMQANDTAKTRDAAAEAVGAGTHH